MFLEPLINVSTPSAVQQCSSATAEVELLGIFNFIAWLVSITFICQQTQPANNQSITKWEQRYSELFSFSASTCF